MRSATTTVIDRPAVSAFAIRVTSDWMNVSTSFGSAPAKSCTWFGTSLTSATTP